MYDTGALKVKEKADKNNLLSQNVLRCNTLTFISRIPTIFQFNLDFHNQSHNINHCCLFKQSMHIYIHIYILTIDKCN